MQKKFQSYEPRELFLSETAIVPKNIFPVEYKQNEKKTIYTFKAEIDASMKYISLPSLPDISSDAQINDFITMCSITKSELSSSFKNLDKKYIDLLSVFRTKPPATDISMFTYKIDGYSDRCGLPRVIDLLRLYNSSLLSYYGLYTRYIDNIHLRHDENILNSETLIKNICYHRYFFIVVQLRIFFELSIKIETLQELLNNEVDTASVLCMENNIDVANIDTLSIPFMTLLKASHVFNELNDEYQVVYTIICKLMVYIEEILKWAFLSYKNVEKRKYYIKICDNILFNSLCKYSYSKNEPDHKIGEIYNTVHAWVTGIYNINRANLYFSDVNLDVDIKIFKLILLGHISKFICYNLQFLAKECPLNSLVDCLDLCDGKKLVNSTGYREPLLLVSYIRVSLHCYYNNNINDVISFLYLSLKNDNIWDLLTAYPQLSYNELDPIKLPNLKDLSIEKIENVILNAKNVIYFTDSIHLSMQRVCELSYIYFKTEERSFEEYYLKLNSVLVYNRLKGTKDDRLAVYILGNTADRINQFIFIYNTLFSHLKGLLEYISALNLDPSSELYNKIVEIWSKNILPLLIKIIKYLPFYNKNLFDIEISSDDFIKSCVPYCLNVNRENNLIKHIKADQFITLLKLGGYMKFSIAYTSISPKVKNSLIRPYLIYGANTTNEITNDMDHLNNTDASCILMTLLPGAEPILDNISDIDCDSYIPFHQILFNSSNAAVINLSYILATKEQPPLIAYIDILKYQFYLNNAMGVYCYSYLQGITSIKNYKKHSNSNGKYLINSIARYKSFDFIKNRVLEIKDILHAKVSTIYPYDDDFDLITVGNLDKDTPLTLYSSYDSYINNKSYIPLTLALLPTCMDFTIRYQEALGRLSNVVSNLYIGIKRSDIEKEDISLDDVKKMVECCELFAIFLDQLLNIHFNNLKYSLINNVQSNFESLVMIYTSVIWNIYPAIIALKCYSLICNAMISSIKDKNSAIYNYILNKYNYLNNSIVKITNIFKECGSFLCARHSQDGELPTSFSTAWEIIYKLHNIDVNSKEYHKNLFENFDTYIITSIIRCIIGVLYSYWYNINKIHKIISAIPPNIPDPIKNDIRLLRGYTEAFDESIKSFVTLIAPIIGIKDDIFIDTVRGISILSSSFINDVYNYESNSATTFDLILETFNRSSKYVNNSIVSINQIINDIIDGVIDVSLSSAACYTVLRGLQDLKQLLPLNNIIISESLNFILLIRSIDKILKHGNNIKEIRDIKEIIIEFIECDFNDLLPTELYNIKWSNNISDLKYDITNSNIYTAVNDNILALNVLDTELEVAMKTMTIPYKELVQYEASFHSKSFGINTLFRCFIATSNFILASNVCNVFFNSTDNIFNNLWQDDMKDINWFIYSIYGGLNTEYMNKADVEMAWSLTNALEISPVVHSYKGNNSMDFILSSYLNYFKK
jgi:hypothetical protein